MSADILQKFLNKRLFQVGGDDARLERIREAANEVADILATKSSKAPQYALVAMDPSVSNDEPLLGEISEVLEKHWQTYVNCFADTPTALFRAIILEAFRLAIQKDVGIASALALTARNVISHFDVSSEKEIWDDLISDADQKMEDQAAKEWSISISAQSPTKKPETGLVKLAAPKANKQKLTESLYAASGPNDRENNPTSGNPYWPNNGQQWSHEFAPRASSAIAIVIDDVLQKAFQGTVGNLPDAVESIAESIGTQLQQTAQSIESVSSSLNRRSNLLWWKETLYSPTMKKSYRSLPPVSAITSMAVDMHHLATEISPISVEYFLRETASELLGEDDKETGLGQLCRDLLSEKEFEPLVNQLEPFEFDNGRLPLVGFLKMGLVAGESLADREFERLIGLPVKTKLSLSEFSVFIFRELQAIRATPDKKAAPKKRARKRKVS